MQYLFTYNPLQYLDAQEASQHPEALAPIGDQSEDITIGQLSDLMCTVDSALKSTGSAFKVVCLVGGDYFYDLSEFDRALTAPQIKAHPLTFAEVRDAIPLMYDILASCGQKDSGIRHIIIYADYFLRGEPLRDGQHRELYNFIQEVRRNEA